MPHWLLTVPVDGELDAEDVSAQLWAGGTTGISEISAGDHRVLQAGFDDEMAAQRARAELDRPTAEPTPVEADGWVDAWRQASLPTVVGPLVVRAPWHPATAGNRLELVVDPGSTFGHGGHPTTRLVLAALVQHAPGAPSVLDVGCGSGVLAIAAAALGASRVVAVDVDPDAVAVTIANARRNGVAVQVRRGSVEPDLGRFQLVVANLLAVNLRQLAPLLVASVERGGLLVVSGLLADQRPAVEAGLAPLRLVAERLEGDWVALELGA